MEHNSSEFPISSYMFCVLSLPSPHFPHSGFTTKDMTNGGVQGPMDSYNSLEEHLHALSTTQYPPTTVGYVHPKWIEPYFDPSTPRNVTALMGKSAYLSCRVRNLGNKTVST